MERAKVPQAEKACLRVAPEQGVCSDGDRRRHPLVGMLSLVLAHSLGRVMGQVIIRNLDDE